jgi:hypothetical protein
MDADDHATGMGLRQDFEERSNTAEVEQAQTVMVVDEAHPNVRSGHTLVLQITRPTKRRRSPSSSARNPIDLASEHQICINGKMCELIDLSEDKVLSREYSCCNLLIN